MKKIELKKISLEDVKKRFRELIQISILIYRNYSDTETKILAISLTYFSLLALFPLLALILGITKGFGLDKLFIEKMFELVPQNEGMVRMALDIANKLLKTTEGSILTGVGIIVLITSVIKLLMMLENTFNKIWHVSKNRSYTRRVMDCVAIIFIGPIFLIVLIATNTFVIEMANMFFFGNTLVIGMFIKILGPIFYVLLFTLVFYLIPNTEVKIKPAVISGILTAFICYVLKTAFIYFQSSLTKYNAIYGSLAFIPIFLIWVQYIWVTILLGAQISFSLQSSDEFKYDEKIEMPIKVKKELGLLVIIFIIERFCKNEKPYSYLELSKKIGVESVYLKDVLSELEKLGYINEILHGENSGDMYQIAINPETFLLKNFIFKFENKNGEYYENVYFNLEDEAKVMLEKIQKKLEITDEIYLKDFLRL